MIIHRVISKFRILITFVAHCKLFDGYLLDLPAGVVPRLPPPSFRPASLALWTRWDTSFGLRDFGGTIEYLWTILDASLSFLPLFHQLNGTAKQPLRRSPVCRGSA